MGGEGEATLGSLVLAASENVEYPILQEQLLTSLRAIFFE